MKPVTLKLRATRQTDGHSSGFCAPSPGGRLRNRLMHSQFLGLCEGLVLARRWQQQPLTTAGYVCEYVHGLGFAFVCAGTAAPKWLALVR